MQRTLLRSFIIVLTLFFVLCVGLFPVTQVSASVSYTDAYTTLSNARFSTRALLGAALSSGDTIFTITTTGSSTYDEDVNNMFPGDTVCFGAPTNTGCQAQTTYTINNIINASDTRGISAGVSAALLASDMVVSSQSGTMTISFTPATTVPSGGKLVLTIPSATSAYSDGMPEATGWDSAALPADLIAGTCSVADSCYSDTGFTASAVALTNAGAGVHTVTITLSSAVNAASGYSFRLGDTSDATLRFQNPVASGTSHTRGLADTYSIELKSQNAGQTLTYDDTIMKVAPNDGVFVSASVEESITYQINDSSNGYSGNIGSAVNVTQCNGGSFTTDVATTPYGVPFGSILNFDTFYRAAQSHYIVTNAADGYTLTVMSDGPLSILGGASNIPNGTCDGACTSSSAAAWVTAGNNGFGYTLGNITGTDASFTSNFRIFDASTAQTIATKATGTSGSRVASCYMLSVDPTQATGYYFNELTYVATPRF